MKFDLSDNIDRKRAEAYFNKLMEDHSKMEIKKFVKKRTLNQNNYLYSVLTIFSDNTGYTVNEVKDLFSNLIPDLFYEKKGQKFRKSTADMDTKEISQLIDLIRETSLNELGVYIPTSEEHLINRFEIEKQYGI